MVHERIDESSYRIEKLEQAVHGLIQRERWWKKLGRIAGICIIVFAFGGAQKAAVQKTVDAEAFILRDSDGRARAKLVMDRAKKQPTLFFIDDKNEATLVLNLEEDGAPLFTLFGKDDKTNCQISMGEDGNSPSLSLSRDGLNGLALHAGKAGWTNFSLTGRSGKQRFAVYERDGTIALGLAGEQMRDQVRMRIAPNGAPDFAVLDKEGHMLLGAPKP